jgi:hypothetical protein
MRPVWLLYGAAASAVVGAIWLGYAIWDLFDEDLFKWG